MTYTTSTVHLIANGESRLKLNINDLSGLRIGCNAIHRDHTIDRIVAVDRALVQEALDAGYPNKIYTRRDWYTSFVYSPQVVLLPPLPYVGDQRSDDPWHWGSGTHAANLAGSLNPKEVHLWGYDLWGNEEMINNCYKGTKHYDPRDHHAIDPSYWVYQLGKCFQHYSTVTWIQHQPEGWSKPPSWIYNNLKISNDIG